MYGTSKVGNPTLAQINSGHLQEANQSQSVFSDQELKEYFIVDSDKRPTYLHEKVNLISFERLKNILNTIEKSNAGRNILVVLKKLLGPNPEKKICFASLNALLEAKNNIYALYNGDDQTFRNAFDGNTCHKGFIKMFEIIKKPHSESIDWKRFLMSEVLLSDFDNMEELGNFLESKKLISSDDIEAIKEKYNIEKINYGFSGNNNYCININEEITKLERFVFDGEKIIAENLQEMLGSKEALEAYIIAHELVHLISFITFEKASNLNPTTETWSTRKDNWGAFFKTPKMNPIYEELQKKYQDNEISQAFKNLFFNVEEARNLLGFVPENRQDLPEVGEFFLFNEKEKFLLPTYLTEVRELTDIEKTVLNTISEKLGVSLYEGPTSDEVSKFQQFWHLFST